MPLARPLVMGVVNVTPDSFSDGGSFLAASAAVSHAEKLIDEGADLIDIGAESSRPGAQEVSLETELNRLMPVLAALRDVRIPISIDTYKPEVMRRVLDAGASMINDIWAFRRPGAIEAVLDNDCGLCVMHMQGDPGTMQADPSYRDVVVEVREFLATRSVVLEDLGVASDRIVVDPGFGFGKSVEQNFALLRSLDALQGLGKPILAGLSRKSMLGAVTGRPTNDRAGASIAAALLAASRGARLLRVHDVALTVEALKIWEIVENQPSAPSCATDRPTPADNLQ